MSVSSLLLLIKIFVVRLKAYLDNTDSNLLMTSSFNLVTSTKTLFPSMIAF